MSARLAAAFTTCQIALGVILSPQILSIRLTRRKIAPPLMPAAVVHSSTDRKSTRSTFCGLFHHVPDRLGCNSIAPNLIHSTYSAEDRPTVDASRRGPLIDSAFRQHWNRNGTDVLPFADHVSNYAVLFADLEIFRSEPNQFGPSQAASNEQRQNRPITFAP